MFRWPKRVFESTGMINNSTLNNRKVFHIKSDCIQTYQKKGSVSSITVIKYCYLLFLTQIHIVMLRSFASLLLICFSVLLCGQNSAETAPEGMILKLKRGLLNVALILPTTLVIATCRAMYGSGYLTGFLKLTMKSLPIKTQLEPPLELLWLFGEEDFDV